MESKWEDKKSHSYDHDVHKIAIKTKAVEGLHTA